jgi:hypothetical protein
MPLFWCRYNSLMLELPDPFPSPHPYTPKKRKVKGRRRQTTTILPSCSEAVPDQDINNEERELDFTSSVQPIKIRIHLTEMAATKQQLTNTRTLVLACRVRCLTHSNKETRSLKTFLRSLFTTGTAAPFILCPRLSLTFGL